MKSKKQVWLGSDSRKDRLEVRLEEEKMPAGTPRQEADREKLLFFKTLEDSLKERLRALKLDSGPR